MTTTGTGPATEADDHPLRIEANALGWGLVTNTGAHWLTWQGYLLGPFGLGGKIGAWAYASLGALFALLLGFAATLAFERSAVRTQESDPSIRGVLVRRND